MLILWVRGWEPLSGRKQQNKGNGMWSRKEEDAGKEAADEKEMDVACNRDGVKEEIRYKEK